VVKKRMAEWARFKDTTLAQLNRQLTEAKLDRIALAE